MATEKRGERGPRGDQGSFGHEGPQGIQGVKGPKGEQGPKRVEPIHPWRWRALTVWVLAFSIGYGYMLWELSHARRTNCQRVSTVIRDIVSQSDGSLGKPGTPGYQYYKSHPDELQAAHDSNKDLIAGLNPAKCK